MAKKQKPKSLNEALQQREEELLCNPVKGLTDIHELHILRSFKMSSGNYPNMSYDEVVELNRAFTGLIKLFRDNVKK